MIQVLGFLSLTWRKGWNSQFLAVPCLSLGLSEPFGKSISLSLRRNSFSITLIFKQTLKIVMGRNRIRQLAQAPPSQQSRSWRAVIMAHLIRFLQPALEICTQLFDLGFDPFFQLLPLRAFGRFNQRMKIPLSFHSYFPSPFSFSHNFLIYFLPSSLCVFKI